MIIKDQKIYDGPFIHQRFAYKYFRDTVNPIGDLVAFIAPAKVEADGMIDQEDILKKDYIYSDKMINFCWEIPYIKDSFGAVTFQRLFNTGIADILSKHIGAPVTVDGDDIMVIKEHEQGGVKQNGGKASVSITHIVNNAAIGHTGINVNAGENAPPFAFSTNLDENATISFINEVTQFFYWLIRDIQIATTKTM